ncbi:hypothetical protein Trydic_g2852 [Trypoxylus dichotomus]
MSGVQKRMEKMAEELEQMRRIKLFSPEHCRNILKMRKHYEYKIYASSKNKEDFLDYIEFEKELLNVVRLRRNSKRINEKMGDIEHKIINRIKELYEMVTQRYKEDVTLFLAQFKFCKQMNYDTCASVVVSNMVRNHTQSVEMWQVVARWFAYDKKDISSALKLICKGITFHKDSKVLYTEAIKMEIYNLLGGNLELKLDPEGLTDTQKLCIEKLQTYIKEIINHVKDYEYYIELLNYLGEYNFSCPVQDTIVKHLMMNYPNKAQTWNVIAQRDYKGLLNPMDKELPPNTTKTKLVKCIERYREGLTKVPPEEREQLWTFFLNCLIDCRQEHHGVAIHFKTSLLKEALEDAFKHGYLAEKHYIQWLDLVDDNGKLEILKRGVEQIPQSVELWKVYLRTQIVSDDRQGIEAVFRAGVEALQGKALPLWTGVIRYYLLSADDDTMEALYREGVRQPQEVSDVLKPEFVEWLAIAKGMRHAREEYLALARQQPYCKELHNTMSKLESTEIDFNFDAWENVHRLACEQFGKEDVDVWMNWIQYYMDFRRGSVSKAILQQIYMDAQNSLPEVLFLSFKDKVHLNSLIVASGVEAKLAEAIGVPHPFAPQILRCHSLQFAREGTKERSIIFDKSHCDDVSYD